jgi:hypothetical protein
MKNGGRRAYRFCQIGCECEAALAHIVGDEVIETGLKDRNFTAL